MDHDQTAESAQTSLEGQRGRGAVATLTPVQREAVELAFFGGYTHTEVANLLDVPVGTAKTRIRTGLGEELTVPNSLVLGTVTKNYSRVNQGRGFVLDTTVTIGYDTPWRQVEAAMAARLVVPIIAPSLASLRPASVVTPDQASGPLAKASNAPAISKPPTTRMMPVARCTIEVTIWICRR